MERQFYDEHVISFYEFFLKAYGFAGGYSHARIMARGIGWKGKESNNED